MFDAYRARACDGAIVQVTNLCDVAFRPNRHRNKNQGCHNSKVRTNTESIFRVTGWSSARLSSGTRDNSKNRVALLTSECCNFLKSSEHVLCVHRQSRLQPCTMCLKYASSERDLSLPQMI